jgi:hypothetical protein
MILRQLSFALITTLILSLVTFGQTSKSEYYLKRYLSQLKTFRVDTFVVIKSGCTGCVVKYSDTSKSVSDGQAIYLLFQRKGQYKIVSFDDFGTERQYFIDTCSLFDTIVRHKPILRQKEIFYKKELAELKKAKFLPPKPSHYNFQELIVQLPNFKYELKLVENEFDQYGFERENENWFVLTKIIINKFFSILKNAHD